MGQVTTKQVPLLVETTRLMGESEVMKQVPLLAGEHVGGIYAWIWICVDSSRE